MSDATDHHGEQKQHGEHGKGKFFPVKRSTLSTREDEIMSRVIGCAMAVHKTLGAGVLESIYQRAMAVELTAQRLTFESQRPVRVSYRDVQIPGQRIDLVVERLVVVELKCVRQFDEIHLAQVISYLKTTGLRAGLLIISGCRC